MPIAIPFHVKFCMRESPIFSAEMACRYGGNLADTRRLLDRLALFGTLVKRSRPGSVDCYYRSL